MNNAKVAGVLCFLVLVALSSCSLHARAANDIDHCLLDKKKVMRDFCVLVGAGRYPWLGTGMANAEKVTEITLGLLYHVA
ncbi:hypothetical protein CFC21_104763 [Triticum aestivum]|uniref:Uncharacterized protein n=2 Tax=Triticum aestivum TaxID=4565 RepID=A0A9R1MAY0_WHEAT|nr:hypothetical protein CFC21_104763 [Triticum aestivum]